MQRDQDFFLQFGDTGTSFFTGVVEERNDPMMLGRVRVRIFGIHPMDRTEVPTEALPWSSVMLPVTEAGASGIGANVPGLIEGSWVIGFFRDGISCQDPIVLGSLPSISPPNWTGPSSAPSPSQALDQLETSQDGGSLPTLTESQLQQKNQTLDEAFTEDIVADLAETATTAASDIAGIDTKASIQTALPAPFENDFIPGDNPEEDGFYDSFQDFPNNLNPEFIDKVYKIESATIEPIKSSTSTALSNHYGYQFEDYELDSLTSRLNRDSFTPGLTNPVGKSSPLRYTLAQRLAEGLALEYFYGNEGSFSNSLQNVIRTSVFDSGINQILQTAFNPVTDLFNDVADIISTPILGVVSDLFPSFSPESFVNSIFGSLAAPPTLIPGVVNNFLDGMTQFTLGNIVSDSFDFDFTGDITATANAIKQQIAIPLDAGFGDIRRGVFPGSNSSRPLTQFPLLPSESDINRVSRGDATVNQPGGMKYNYDAQRDSLFPNEPAMEYAPTYPYNHYKETEGGHVFEYDDTPDFERLQIRHKSGTGFHVNPDGTNKLVVYGDNYAVYLKDNRIHIYGALETYIDTDAKVSINGEANIQVGTNANISVGGNCKVDVDNSVDIAAGCDIRLSSGRDIQIKAERDITMLSRGNSPRKDLCGTVKDDSEGSGITMISQNKSIMIGAKERIDVISQDITNIQGPTAIHLNSFGNEYSVPSPGRFQTIRNLHETKPHKSEEFAIRHEGLLSSEGGGLSQQDYVTAMKNGELSLNRAVHRQNDIVCPRQIDDSPTPAQSASDRSVNVNILSNDYRNPNNPIYDLQISDYFKLRDLTWKPVVQRGQYLISKCGLSEEELIRNLSNLAAVVLDPLADKFGGSTFNGGKLQITSGFRQKSSCRSWHSKGCAVDIQVVGLHAGGFYDLAVECKTLLKGFDHILLEYAPSRTNRPWLHLGARRDEARGLCQTYYNDRPHQQGQDKFVNLGYTYK